MLEYPNSKDYEQREHSTVPEENVLYGIPEDESKGEKLMMNKMTNSSNQTRTVILIQSNELTVQPEL